MNEWTMAPWAPDPKEQTQGQGHEPSGPFTGFCWLQQPDMDGSPLPGHFKSGSITQEVRRPLSQDDPAQLQG